MSESPDREPHAVPPMSPGDWNSFVAQVAAGHAVTSTQIPPDMWASVFMPLMLGALADWTEEELSQIGCMWENLDKAGPRSINGYPIFTSFRLVNTADWERAVPEIRRRQAILHGEDALEES